jgi:steroid delta-isomerase-like uncharacterized protein
MRASIAKDGEETGNRWLLETLLASWDYSRSLPWKPRPNWLLSATRGKATMSERSPSVPDYKSLIRTYYSELWNAWTPAALEDLISPAIVFRGSIGTIVAGIEEFKRYVNRIRAAFPDFHNHIDELIGEGEKVVARLTYTGTHRGELFGFRGTGKKISYQGVGIFQFRESKIVSGFVLGDTESLKRQIAPS